MKKPARIQFPKGLKASEILKRIRDRQDAWAKANPVKAHVLYPTVYDEKGERIKK